MSRCSWCGKDFDEAVFYGCNEYPCNTVMKEVKPDNILLARQSITDAKNMLLSLPGCTKFDVAGKLDVALGYLNRDSG